MRGDLRSLDQSADGANYKNYLEFPDWWKRPEGWDPTWKLQIRVTFNDDEDVTSRMLSVHSPNGEPLMVVDHYRVEPDGILEDWEALGVEPIVFGGNILIADELQGKHLALAFWTLAEILLMDTDLRHQRLIMDLSGKGWTEKVQARFIEILKQYFPEIRTLFEQRDDGLYLVVYDFGKPKYNL